MRTLRRIDRLRGASERWRTISQLTLRLEALVRAHMQIDSKTIAGSIAADALQHAAMLDRRITNLQADIQHEIATVTAKLLQAELRAAVKTAPKDT